MNELAPPDGFGTLSDPLTLTIKRLLPGPVERVWAYLTESELRRQWLASGEMDGQVGSSVELVWSNDELTDPPGERPDGMSPHGSRQCTITAFEPNRRLGFTWGDTGGVTIDLEPVGTKVLLTLVHHRVADRAVALNVSSGWHSHLDVLAARISGEAPAPFWDNFRRVQQEYQRRLPG